MGTLAPAAASLRIAARSFASLPRHLLCPVGPPRADHYAARGALSFVARYLRRTLLSSQLPLICHLAEKSRLREPIVSPEILSRAANVFQQPSSAAACEAQSLCCHSRNFTESVATLA